MKNKNEGPEYLLIKNPMNGKHVNVMPLFVLLEECHSAESGSLNNFIKPLQEMQDFINTEMCLKDRDENTFMELGNVNFNIIRLRRMFEAMAEAV
ncbi:hypothetical protein [Lacihabitans soyangensis]|uniref:Uncharacterized protein n=1 Tax=Lacihabitans soyangensis TaxID=869394 RepID=A0AAE3KUN1_9BACT|nr:hypothetical protein [Lacihabitans soyangensis]MCP9765114.1 hypothetical protein [Lacihabitans soyangensis]